MLVIFYLKHVYFVSHLDIQRILHECSCFIEFIKRDGESDARLAEHFITFFATSLINSKIQEHEC